MANYPSDKDISCPSTTRNRYFYRLHKLPRSLGSRLTYAHRVDCRRVYYLLGAPTILRGRKRRVSYVWHRRRIRMDLEQLGRRARSTGNGTVERERYELLSRRVQWNAVNLTIPG